MTSMEGGPTYPEKEEIFKPDEVIQDRWKVLNKISHRNKNRTRVYKAYDSKLKKEVAIKVSKIDRIGLRTEVRVLLKLKKVDHFCKCFHYNSDNELNFIVIELQGPNLSGLRKRYGMFPLTTILRAGLQMLEAVRYVHEAGFMHGNIRPSNFIIGRTNCRIVYLIDFSRARELQSSTKHGSEIKETGNRNFCKYSSPAVHYGTPMGRRDDLWSLLYTLIGCKGVLPWAKDKEEVQILKKKNEKTDYLINFHLTNHFIEFKHHLSSLDIDSTPNYDILRNCFTKALKLFKITEDMKYHWENYPKHVHKSYDTRSIQHVDTELTYLNLNELNEEQKNEIQSLSRNADLKDICFYKGRDPMAKILRTDTIYNVLFKIPYEKLTRKLKDYILSYPTMDKHPKDEKVLNIIYNNPKYKPPIFRELFLPKSVPYNLKLSQILAYPIQTIPCKSDDPFSLQLDEVDSTPPNTREETQTSVTLPETIVSDSNDSQIIRSNIVVESIEQDEHESQKQRSDSINFITVDSAGKSLTSSGLSSSFNNTKQSAAGRKHKLVNDQDSALEKSKNILGGEKIRDGINKLLPVSSPSSSNVKEKSKNILGGEKVNNGIKKLLPMSSTSSSNVKENQIISQDKRTSATKGKKSIQHTSEKKSLTSSYSFGKIDHSSKRDNPDPKVVENTQKRNVDKKAPSSSSPPTKNTHPASKGSKKDSKSKNLQNVQNTSSAAGSSNSSSGKTSIPKKKSSKTSLTKKKLSSHLNTAAGSSGKKSSQKGVTKSKPKSKQKNKNTKPLKILSTSLATLSLPDHKQHLVPPKPEARPVYRPDFSVSLITIPENESLSSQLMGDRRPKMNNFQEHLFVNRNGQLCRKLSAQFAQFNTPIQAIFLDPYHEYIYIQGTDTDHFRHIIPNLYFCRNTNHIAQPSNNSREVNQVTNNTQEKSQNKLTNAKKKGSKTKKSK